MNTDYSQLYTGCLTLFYNGFGVALTIGLFGIAVSAIFKGLRGAKKRVGL